MVVAGGVVVVVSQNTRQQARQPQRLGNPFPNSITLLCNQFCVTSAHGSTWQVVTQSWGSWRCLAAILHPWMVANAMADENLESCLNV